MGKGGWRAWSHLSEAKLFHWSDGGLRAQAALAFEGNVGTLGLAVAEAGEQALAKTVSQGSGLGSAFPASGDLRGQTPFPYLLFS